MSLASVVPALQSQDPWQDALARAVARLPRGRALEVDGIPVAARVAALAAAISASERPVVIVTGRLDTAEELTALLSEYLEEPRTPVLWSVPEALPYEQLPLDRAVSARRVEVLTRLRDGGPAVIVVPARGLTQLISPPGELARQRIEIRIGQRLRLDQVVAELLDEGYELVSLVAEPGQVSRRGGIIDIFPPGAEHALRVDLFGDEVDSLRLFDPATQRSINQIQTFSLMPPLETSLRHHRQAAERLAAIDTAALRPEVVEEWERAIRRLDGAEVTAGLELFAPFLLLEPASLLDYLPEDHLLVVVDPSSVRLSIEQLEAQSEELREALEEAGELPHGVRRPYHTWDRLSQRLSQSRQLVLGTVPIGWPPPVALPLTEHPGFAYETPSFGGRLDRLVEELRTRLDEGWAVVLATEQARRVAEVLEEHDIFPRVRKDAPGLVPRRAAPPTPGTVEVVHSRLSGGWENDPARLLVLSDREVFGYRHVARQPGKRRAAPNPTVLERLVPGSYVVHIEHGIARYGGIVQLEVSGVDREYLLLEYAANDRLYLPIDQIERITAYEGGGVEPKLTRLGSPEWARVKQRVRQAVREMAFELLQLYAAREAAQGQPFGPDAVWDHELEESFPYVETPDQLRAINEVKADLQQTRPMDRLVCGDVGYGKTEVALRAAFKAVNAGYQVAILVPTTVLALQHFRSFQSRLAPFPVKVEMLSRLRSRKEQERILAGLRDGEVDIVIGTHRLLQKDVEFRRLGLLVIDEEQRFGVTHKEQLKRARTNVHVLTMTATPIPRTLHMALSGIRDLSVINTPPRDRTPIRTFVTASSDRLIREAVLREISRGGQVYFVHNRVQSIYHTLQRLQRLVPEARFGVGHGQMDEDELERVIVSFVDHEFDGLLCTTIIESGVDIPNVNTVIIDQAQNLGLTQLYQLRGRVGRSNHRAYAYLLYDDKRALSSEAIARLEAIQEATELGAGFQIALRDLEIRGAGNVLGAEQSGHIAAVGFDLYTRLLAMAVEEVRQGRPIEEPEEISIDLPVDAVVPAIYAGDEEIRIDIYRKLAAVRSYGELRDVQEELLDRFGPMPEPVQRLVDLARLRIRASGLGITSIVEREGEIYIRPLVGQRLSQPALRREIGSGVTVTPNQVRLTVSRLDLDPWSAVQRVVGAIEDADATVLATAS